MRCAMCNRIMNSSFDDYEGGLCARCAHQDMHSTTITFIPDDGLAYRQFITPRQEPSSIPCIICGEDVGFCKMDVPWMICDNCRKAVLHVREKLKGKGE